MVDHPLGRFQPCATCCPTGCVYFTDNFDRGNNTALGADWTETTGDWEIYSQALRTTGSVAKVFLGDSGYYAEIEPITSTCGRLRIYDGATCKGSVGVTISPWVRVSFCSKADQVSIFATGASGLHVPATVTSDVVALGVDSSVCTCNEPHPTSSNKYIVTVTISFGSGTVSFEDFSLSKHKDDDATCPACGAEGCTWFSDSGCASGSLSATDWTATGTWTYDNGLKCTSDGAIVVVPTQPLAAATYGVYATIALPTAGVSVKLYYDDGEDAYILLDRTVPGVRRARLFVGGVQYGRTHLFSSSDTTADLRLCYDGSLLTAYLSGQSESALATLDSNSSKVVVSGLTGGATLLVSRVVAVKDNADIGLAATCLDCGTPNCCTTCQSGTIANTVQVALAGMIAKTYGCACPDSTFTLEAATPAPPSTDCVWFLSSELCGAIFQITARVIAVTGGYKLYIVASGLAGTAWFEKTILGGVPNCLTDFDGDIPLSWNNPFNQWCDFASATCTFTAPAP